MKCLRTLLLLLSAAPVLSATLAGAIPAAWAQPPPGHPQGGPPTSSGAIAAPGSAAPGQSLTGQTSAGQTSPGQPPNGLTGSQSAQAPVPPANPASPGISSADAQRVIDLLNDPKKRADFTATLDAIARTLPPVAPASTADQPATSSAATAPNGPAVAIPLAPNSLGAQLLVSASGLVNRLTERLHATLQDIRSIPPMGGWILMMASDPLGQKLLLDTAWRLAVTFAAGLAAEWVTWWILRGPVIALSKRRPVARNERDGRAPLGGTSQQATNGGDGDFPERVPIDVQAGDGSANTDEEPNANFAHDGQARAELGAIEPPDPPRSVLLARVHLLPGILLRLALTLVPIFSFLLAAHLVISTSISEVYLTRLILLAMIDAYAVSRVILCTTRAILAPDAPRWRLLPMSTATATSGVRWIRRLTVVCVFGYAAAEAGLLLGMSQVTHEALLKSDGLILLVMAVIIVLRNRAAVAELISARPGHTGPFVRWRKRLASAWHIIAVLYLIGLWLVWAIDVPDGFRRLLSFFVITLMVAAAARVARSALLGLLDRHLREDDAETARHPNLTARVRAYHPVLSFLVQVVVGIAAVIALTQLWGLGTLEWLTDNMLAHRMMSALTTIAIATAFSIGVWEAANAGIQNHLSKLQRDAQTARSARLRTLLPMLRTALLIGILAVMGMVVLSEIGVNIAPLLAGAGVIGIAIGFGSQKLVQDVITGLFLLLENTMQVGDVVSLGGLTGVVEHLSIRTIRLRAEDGSVHVIPFSAVTTVTNMTRDFAHAVIEAQVAYKDDYDQVVEVLRGIVAQMRTEPRWQSEIRDDLEVMGLQRFADSAVVIKCRIRCGPFGRWAVMREFNRRMKMRFDEEGIEIPFPHQKMIIDDQTTLHMIAPAARPSASLVPPAP